MGQKIDPITGLFTLLSLLILVGSILFVPEQLQLRSEEPRRAIVAMEMIFSGDFLKPQLNGWPYYNKPPLFSWVLAVFMKVFNSFDEWVVRLPGLLAFVITGGLIFRVSASRMNAQAALFGSLFFLTGGEILFYGLVMAGQIDLFFTLLTFLQMMTLYLGLVGAPGGQARYLLWSAFFLALGTLTKGLPSIAFHVLTLLGWAIANRSLKPLWKWEHLAGMVIWLFVVGGYFFWYHHSGGEAWIYLINLYKEASQKSGLEGSWSDVVQNFIEFPFLFLKSMLPWSIMLVLLFLKRIRNTLWKHSLGKFSLVFIGANILLYWSANYISLRYIYPFLPFLAIILGLVVDHGFRWRPMRLLHYLVLLLIILPPLGFAAIPLLDLGILVSHYGWKLAIIALSGALLLFSQKKWKDKQVFIGVLAIVLIKVYSIWIYYPQRAADDRNDNLYGQVIQYLPIIGTSPVGLYGDPLDVVRDASIGPLKFGEVAFQEAMQVSFQHIYYIERHREEIMPFHSTMIPDYIYLARRDDVVDLPVTILYSFVDDWKNQPLVLCTLSR